MTGPTVTCTNCGLYIDVIATGRGFPPDNAERKLRKLCKSNGCECVPKYRAGIAFGRIGTVGQGGDEPR